jgi:hypothetical protein
MDGISGHRWLLAMKLILRKNNGQPVYQFVRDESQSSEKPGIEETNWKHHLL